MNDQWADADVSQFAPHSAPRGWLRWCLHFEAMAALVTAFFMSFFSVIPLLIGALIAAAEGRWDLAWPTFFGFLIATPLAMWLVRAAQRAVDTCFAPQVTRPQSKTSSPSDDLTATHSFAVELALTFPQLPWILNVAISLWWGAHFAAGTAISVMVHDGFVSVFPQPWMSMLLIVALHFAFSVAANLYLVLAASLLWRNAEFLDWLWSIRFYIDTVITLASVAVWAMS